MADVDIRQFLKPVSLFANVDDESIDKLVSLVVSKDYAKDALVVGQDEPGDAMYIISAGRVKVVLYGENGREITLTHFAKGDFFGEMSLIDNQPRSANVITTEPSTLLFLKREAFIQHLRDSPSTAINVMAELSRRLRKADSIIGNLALLDVYGRVARVLSELARTEGEDVEGGTMIHRRPTQQELANMVSTSRETVSRVLNDFQKRGLLVMDGKQVIIRPQFYREAF